MLGIAGSLEPLTDSGGEPARDELVAFRRIVAVPREPPAGLGGAKQVGDINVINLPSFQIANERLVGGQLTAPDSLHHRLIR